MIIDERIADIDRTICENIDLIDFDGATRALISQNLLAHSRNLVEHIAVKIYANGRDIDADWDTIPKALEHIKHSNKYLFLRKFHGFLQESKSHYTPDHEGAERLVLKYYQYYLMIRNFAQNEFQMNLLHNLEKFPINTDRSVYEYHKKIADRLEVVRPIRDFGRESRLYVQKVIPFTVEQTVYYEIVLTPAYDTTSKYDRFVCYSKVMLPSYYSIKADIFYDDIELEGRRMPINILTDYDVSIRPCELNNFASIFGENIEIKADYAEYTGMMRYLTRSGASLLDILLAPINEYKEIKQTMFEKSRVHHFEIILDKCRDIVLAEKAGTNVLRYLLLMFNNKIIKDQRGNKENFRLSDLYLEWGCIPFDTMPFATSLLGHNPESSKLFSSISTKGREHELVVRYIHANMSTNSRLYTPIKELEEYVTNTDELIAKFNDNLYEGHAGRKVIKFGQNVYVAGAYNDTKKIIDALINASSQGLQGYEGAINAWLEDKAYIDSEEKRAILRKMFTQSKVALIYGAAGTGKTYLINQISQFMDERTKLFLANTNPAVENLRRKVKAQNCRFMTIRKYLYTRSINTEFDILVMDECSMISNEDMAKVIDKVNYKLMILVGDTYQIESISFGNWFSMAKYFVPRYAWNELEKPYRTNDPGLLSFWKKVRNLDDDLTEYIVNQGYACNLNASVFDRKSDDEIILCLNYDGLYGINNINKFLQENNPNKAFRWGLWTFKVGDPILINESERFMPVLYNNLKGTIANIEYDEVADKIWFTIEIEKTLTELDVSNTGLQLLDSHSFGKSVVRFPVVRKKDSADDNDFADDSDIPFQIAYAVSIHKAQGLEYDSVKIIITEETDRLITHNIFYTAITRSKKYLKIYWSPETQNRVLNGFELSDVKKDASIFAAQSGLKRRKI